jgi:hypothetical protein
LCCGAIRGDLGINRKTEFWLEAVLCKQVSEGLAEHQRGVLDERFSLAGRRPSAAAMRGAIGRAAHLVWEEEPKILRDNLALRLSRAENEAPLRAALESQMS